MVRAPWRQLIEALRQDFTAFVHHISLTYRQKPSHPTLRSYHVGAKGAERRLHLRIHPDGTGLLLIDAAHAIHLNPTAASIVGMLLDEVPPRRIERLLRAWHREASREQIATDICTLVQTIDALKNPELRCPTCLPQFYRRPLFSHRAQAPYKVDLALTYACNNRCRHCYNEPARKNLPSLDFRGWQQVLRRLKHLGVPHIIFTGGEPTLVEFLPALIRIARQQGQITGLNTNGRRLADPRFSERLQRAGLDHVQITLASYRPDLHNAIVNAPAHSETVAGIRNALAAGLYTITNTTLTRLTAEEAIALVEFVHELGVRTFAMNSIICSGRGRRNPEALSEADLLPVLDGVLERATTLGMRFLWYTPTEYCRLSPIELGLEAKTCNAAEYSVCIEPTGDVLPCQSYYQPVGNLLHDQWGNIWESELFVRLRMRRENPRFAGLDERCYDCPELPICGGGCPLQRLERQREATDYDR